MVFKIEEAQINFIQALKRNHVTLQNPYGIFL